ncbi:MAG: RsmG family class I SAM-dependent methyltransferase [Leptospirillia bacterium]
MNSTPQTLLPSLSSRQLTVLDHYTSLLLEWNTHIRLTGYHSREQVREHLLLEPILAFHFLKGRLPPSLPKIDFGSGNGSPGLIMALLDPDHPYLLVERVQKKRIFLDHVARHLSLSNVTIVPSLSAPVFSPLVFMKAITVHDFLSDKNAKRYLSPPAFFIRFGKDPHPACQPLLSCVINGGVREWDKRINFSLFLLEFSG